MIETISIVEALTYFDFIDTRSVMNWAKKNQVEVFIQGKRKFMIREQFEEAYQKPFINHLNKSKVSYAENYKPIFDCEKKFLKTIINI